MSSSIQDKSSAFRHVNYAWDDAYAAALDPVGRLVYRSNLLGADGRITNTGGGNTSAKLTEPDPLTGDAGRGAVGQRLGRRPAHRQARELLLALHGQAARACSSTIITRPHRGPKTPIEDAIVGLYSHCTFNLNPRPSSIDTPLHAFVPYRHVDHTHPNAVIAIAAARHSERLTREIYGDEVVWTAWQRPGFDLGLKLEQICRDHPQARRA